MKDYRNILHPQAREDNVNELRDEYEDSDGNYGLSFCWRWRNKPSSAVYRGGQYGFSYLGVVESSASKV